MAGVRIVTDSSSDLTTEQAQQHGIEIVPLSIRFGDEEFVDRVELTVEDFYRRMASSSQLPETAAPSPGAFEAAFRRCVEDGADGIVCINLSAGLSATMQSAQTAVKAIDDVEVHVVDSKSVTMGLGAIVLAAADAAAAGRSAADIASEATELASRQRVYGTLDTLDNLKKGGRIGNAQALLGQLLSIKPCIAIEDGVVEEAGRARTRKKALQWLAAKVLDEPAVEDLWVLHGEAPDVDEFIELVGDRYDRDEVSVGLIGPVIGTHGGPRVLGVTYRVPR